MSDRELLELAARAAGLKSDAWMPVDRDRADLLILNDKGGHTVWNPLEDDGDAFQLAVKLFLWEAVRDGHRNVDAGNNFYAATRRAITRAAAEIQRQRESK